MPRAAKTLAIATAVAIVYLAAALLGFRAAFLAQQVTSVWAPTGIAQAALLLWGIKLWPAIWLAAFTANALSGVTLWTAAVIAAGNTLEAITAAWALSRLRGFDPSFKRTRDAAAFILIAVAASPLISAFVGVTALCVSAAASWGNYGELWREWWLGDALGALVVAPAILTIIRAAHQRSQRTQAETFGVVVLTIFLTEIISGGFFSSSIGNPPLAFVIFPFVILAAVRLGQPATSLVTLGAAGVIVWNTMAGYRPFGGAAIHENLLLVHVFMGVLAGSGLLLAAATTERRVLENRRSATYAAGTALAGSSTVDQAAPRVLAAICSNLGWQAAGFWVVDPALDKLRCIATWPEHSSTASRFLTVTKNMTFESGVGLPGRVWATGEPAWIEDVVIDRNFPRAAVAGEAGLHGAFAFPIRHGEHVIGVVEFFSISVAVVDHDLLATMATIGHQIGDFLSRRLIETAAAEQQTRTQTILESALDAIITMDYRGRVTEFNRAAERMFGYSRVEALGRELATLIIPEGLRAHHREGLQRYLDTGKGPFIGRRVDTTAVRSDGHEFPVEVSITRVPTVPPMFTGFVRDVSERVGAERERRELLDAAVAARHEAETANRAKDDFLATLSHELRTPLNAIVGWTRMLLDGILDEPTTRRALAIIDRNAHAQAQLVTDLLDVSRIVTGKLSLNMGPLDLGSVVGAALDTVRPAADAKRIRLTTNMSRSSRLMMGDFQRLQQVVWNLLSNGIKFTPEGGVVNVELSEAADSVLRLTIADNGAGIDPEFLPHVFDRFRQADGSSTRQHGGLGLGLAIVRHVVEQHGGTVRAESGGLGKGATFIVEFPQLPAPARAATVSDAARDRRISDGRRLDGCRVLIIEDQEDARKLLAAVLTNAGASVSEAASANEGLTHFTKHHPDIVLADIGLPGKDGYAFMRELRTLEREGAHIPVAAVTAYARPQDREALVAAGFATHIPKPVEPRALLETVIALWNRPRP